MKCRYEIENLLMSCNLMKSVKMLNIFVQLAVGK